MPNLKVGSSSNSTASRLASIAIGQSQGIDRGDVLPTPYLNPATPGYENELADMMDAGVSMEAEKEDEGAEHFVSVCIMLSMRLFKWLQL